jgi:hypothetical protein
LEAYCGKILRRIQKNERRASLKWDELFAIEGLYQIWDDHNNSIWYYYILIPWARLMIISHKYKFIFVKTAKTAGTSIDVYLSQYCAADDILIPIVPPVPSHVARNYLGVWNPLPDLFYFRAKNIRSVIWHCLKKQKFYNHIPGSIIQQRIHQNIVTEYFKFCVERNPWDLTLSHYHMVNHRTGGNLIFNQYIEEGKFRSNYYLYTDKTGNLILDKVVKYETLLEELGDIFSNLGIPFSGTLGVQAKSEYRKEKTPYQDVYSDQQKKIIEKAFAKEIIMHNYTF